SLELSCDGRRALVATLLRAATGARDDARADVREGANRMTDWLRRALPWSWTTSISTGLRLLQQRLGDGYEAAGRPGLVPWAASNYGRVGTALAVIYIHELVERTREQFELGGS